MVINQNYVRNTNSFYGLVYNKFSGILDANNSQFVLFLESFPTKIIFTLFLIFASIFYTLTISEVFEDYISNFKIKNAANRLLVFLV